MSKLGYKMIVSKERVGGRLKERRGTFLNYKQMIWRSYENQERPTQAFQLLNLPNLVV